MIPTPGHGRHHGAIVIKDLDPAGNWSDLGDQMGLLMNAEFKLSLNAYLKDLLYSPVRSLAQVIAFNKAHPVEVIVKTYRAFSSRVLAANIQKNQN